MTFDANNQILPIAFAYVNVESYDTWSYFIHKVMNHVIGTRGGICLIVDRHSGIMAAVQSSEVVWHGPDFTNKFCVRHFEDNFKNNFKGDKALHDLAHDAIWADQEKKLNAKMQAIYELNPEAYAWLCSEPVEKWSKVHDGGRRFGAMTTNMAEVFNFVLRGARSLPITSVVQFILYRLVAYFRDRREVSMKMRLNHIKYGKNIIKLIEHRTNDTGHEVRCFDMNRMLFSVMTSARDGRGYNVQRVNISRGTCDCGKWQHDGIPCSHVVAVCRSQNLSWESYMSYYYSLDCYEATYATQFEPLADEKYSDSTNVSFVPSGRIRGKGCPSLPAIAME